MTRRIVLAWENYGPTHLDRLRALAAARGRDGVVAIEFFRDSPTYAWAREAAPDLDIRTLSPVGTRAGSAALAWRLVRTCLGVRDADVFLCHYDHRHVIVAAAVLRLCGRRVFTMADSKFDDLPRSALREFLKSLVLLPYRGGIAASRRSRDYLAFLGVPRDRIALGYDSLSVDRMAALGQGATAHGETGFDQRDFVMVARLVPKKNHMLALGAFALWLREARAPRRLHLCGSGPLEEELRAEAARLGIAGHVVFHGFVQSDEVAAILARGLCLLLPSVEEQFGLVVIEAQATGLPVLVSNNAGACDMLIADGVNGFTFDPYGAESLAALMLMLSEDEALWRRLADGAVRRRYAGDARHFVAAVEALSGGGTPGR